MTWRQALRYADAQIAHWRDINLSVAEAEEAVSLGTPEPQRWLRIRQWLAAWAMANRKSWKD